MDLAFIVEKAEVDLQSAKAYLAFYKDPIEVVLRVRERHWRGLPIPEFRERARPALAERYVPRDISQRTGTTALTLQLYDNGYESA